MIPDYDGYQASTLGRIRSYKSNRRTRHAGGLMRPHYDKNGYGRIILIYCGKSVCRSIHLLVCHAFHGPRPSDLHEVDHKDGDPTNNKPDNLRWLKQKLHKARHAIARGQHVRIACRAVAADWNAGEDDLRALCRRHGVSVPRFREWVRAIGAASLRRPLPKTTRGLTRSARDTIRRRLREGKTGSSLAREYNVHPATISRIKTRKDGREAVPSQDARQETCPSYIISRR